MHLGPTIALADHRGRVTSHLREDIRHTCRVRLSARVGREQPPAKTNGDAKQNTHQGRRSAHRATPSTAVLAVTGCRCYRLDHGHLGRTDCQWVGDALTNNRPISQPLLRDLANMSANKSTSAGVTPLRRKGVKSIEEVACLTMMVADDRPVNRVSPMRQWKMVAPSP